MLLAKVLADSRRDTVLHLFDTFEGMPETDPGVDFHRLGDFADTTLESVRSRVLGIAGVVDASVVFHRGLIPHTFGDASIQAAPGIALAHVDVDIHRSVMDCCEFIYPRLVAGGFMVFDDYGFPSCAGARKAVDEYFAQRPEVPLILPTGQAVVFKSFDRNARD